MNLFWLAAAMQQNYDDRLKQSMFDLNSRVNITPMQTFNPLSYSLNPYIPPQPKSGRKVWRDMGDCWIVIASESGPLKLLEIELK